jgi:hypothetical protein
MSIAFPDSKAPSENCTDRVIANRFHAWGGCRFPHLMCVCLCLASLGCTRSAHGPDSIKAMYSEQTIGKGQWMIISPEGSLMFRSEYGAQWNGFYNSDGHGAYDSLVVGTEVALYAPTWLVYYTIAYSFCYPLDKISRSDVVLIPFIVPMYLVNCANAGAVYVYDVVVHDIPMTPVEIVRRTGRERKAETEDSVQNEQPPDVEIPSDFDHADDR